MDSSLEAATEEGEDAVSSDAVMELSSSLELTKCELAACRDCCDEAANQLAKLTGTEKLTDKTRMQCLVLALYECIAETLCSRW